MSRNRNSKRRASVDGQGENRRIARSERTNGLDVCCATVPPSALQQARCVSVELTRSHVSLTHTIRFAGQLSTVAVFPLPAAVNVQVAGRFIERGPAVPSDAEIRVQRQRSEELLARKIVPAAAVLFVLVYLGFAGRAGFRGASAGERLGYELASDAEWPRRS